MPVQMLVGGVEIQMRRSGSVAVADGPYSFSSRFALVSTFSPGAIACAAPLMVHTSLKNTDGDCAKTSEVSDRTTRAARIRLIMRAIIQRPRNGLFRGCWTAESIASPLKNRHPHFCLQSLHYDDNLCWNRGFWMSKIENIENEIRGLTDAELAAFRK